MTPLQKIGAFGAALAASFGAAYGVGTLVGPFDSGTDTEQAAHRSTDHQDTGPAKDTATDGSHESGAHEDPGTEGTTGTSTAADTPAGLQVTEAGYTLDLETKALAEDTPAALRFVVREADGTPVTSYRTEHDKELHLIVASRDLTQYRHLHPTRSADGTWSTPVTLPDAGSYRVFADFTPTKGRQNLTLGSDLTVTGAYADRSVPEPAATATVDGYTVTLDGGLTAGKDSELRFTVRKEGRPVELEPYLGANGHLVALRADDLAYLHVHPHDSAARATDVAFTADVPSAGAYRLFLDFKADGKVRTAAFTADTDRHTHG
ncbi:hypothetical protein IAG44_10840 [Streptomyces roseirectus]|uniref:Secreted protein n=1 Tax=Streptomyces roseirectus TaxID=2768066 RepID=A0A7H0IAT1_9ACTN|nr:hypothetical protein [Streptomyces roseirectus]QNP69897.1 hypothetical protein IAG44_10840 [Streptomyces roseirectus]